MAGPARDRTGLRDAHVALGLLSQPTHPSRAIPANLLHLPPIPLHRQLPRDAAGAWWDERVERTLLHAIKRATKLGTSEADLATAKQLLDVRPA